MADFKDLIVRWYPTGSRYICNPPPTDTDKDTVIFVTSMPKAQAALEADDWQLCGEEYADNDIVAYRKGIDNYILTESPSVFGRWVYATNVSKVMNLLNKEDRIKVFAKIFEGANGMGKGNFEYAEWDEQVLFP